MGKHRNARTSTPTTSERKATVSITVPIASLQEGAYVGNHVDVHLDHRQSRAMRRMMNGFNEGAIRLSGGRVVQNYADVIRWITEQVDIALTKP